MKPAYAAKVTFVLIVAAIVLVFSSPVILAQETTGSIQGTISDVSGARVPGATIKIEGASFIRNATSNEDGFFRIVRVPPGIYKVTVEAPNFGTATAEGVTVVLGISTPVDFSLKVGQVQEQVVITGQDVAPIDPTASKIQTNITAQEFDSLPKGTNFSSILRIAPAVRPEPLGAGFQIDGASGAENTFIIDGQEVTNFRTGQLNTSNNIPFQFVQEVQVKSNGFEAEYGGATGGVINVVTRRGSNAFHGEVGIEFEPDAMWAKPRPILFADSNNLRYINPNKDSFTNYFPTVGVNGPVVKDRLWFLASYTPQIFNTKRKLTYPNGETQTYKSSQRNDYGFIRLDSQVSSKLNLNGSYTYNPIVQHGALDPYTSVSVPGTTLGGKFLRGSDYLAEQGGRLASAIVNVGGTYTPTGNIVLNSRYGRSYLNEKLNSYGIPNEPRYVCVLGNTNVPGTTPGGTCATGFQNFANNFQILKDISTRNTFDVDASILVNRFAGRHQFKVGYQYNKINNDVANGYFDIGIIVLRYGLPLADYIGVQGDPGELGSGYLQRFGTVGEAGSTNQGIFFQDSWQPFSRLTLNLGLRIEKENVPTFAANAPGIEFGWGSKPAPRIGGAFDLFGNGKVKIFASYGMFYDRFKYELPRGSFGGDKFYRDYFSIQAGFPDYNYYTPARALQLSKLQLDFRVPSNDPSDNRIDPDLDAARQSEFTVGGEWEFARNWVFGTRFTHKQIDRAIEDVGIFDAGGNELYFIANPGYGVVSQPLLPNVPATPKAERKYDGLELRVTRRLVSNFSFGANYTYSRLFGNYSGLASSDERGRSSPNVNRFFDLPFLGYTFDGVPDNGRLATDRPHVFRFAGNYNLNWSKFNMGNQNTDFNLFFVAQSGTPLSTQINFYSAATFLYGRGDLGRTPTFKQTDFAFRHDVQLGCETCKIGFLFNVINLFNQAEVTDVFTQISRLNFTASPFGLPGEAEAIQAIFTGGLSQRAINYINANPSARGEARYRNPQSFQAPREIRFGFRFTF